MNEWLPTEEEIDEYQCEVRDDNDNFDSKRIDYLWARAEEEDIKKQIIKQKRDTRKPTVPSKGFVMVHKVNLMKAVREKMFTMAEERMLFKLTPFCNFETNIICDENGLPMTQKDIIDLVGMKKTDVIKIMTSLEDKSVVVKFTKGNNVHYKFNKEWIGR